MAAIDKRLSWNGKTVYRARVRLKGYPPQVAQFPTSAQARQWGKQTEAAILEGRYFPKVEAQRHTVKELIERYRHEVLPNKRASTIPTQRLQLQWWQQEIGDYTLADVTPALLVTYRNTLAADHANATVNRYFAALSHVFTVAVNEWQWCMDNPVRNIRKTREAQGRTRYLSDDERKALLEACQKSRNPYLYTIVVLAITTGARRGELLSLHWSNVDLKRGSLTFPTTKNREARTVPLPGYALEVLTRHAAQRFGSGRFVFPNATDKGPLSIRTAFQFALKHSGVKNFRFHDLRHTAASYLAMNGASLLEIAEILGHKTLAMVKRYAHLCEAYTRGVLERTTKAVFTEGNAGKTVGASPEIFY
jgi:integrase